MMLNLYPSNVSFSDYRYLGSIHTCDLQRDSQSRRIACRQQEWSPESVPANGSIHSEWAFFHSTGIVPVKIMEWPGTIRLSALRITL